MCVSMYPTSHRAHGGTCEVEGWTHSYHIMQISVLPSRLTGWVFAYALFRQASNTITTTRSGDSGVLPGGFSKGDSMKSKVVETNSIGKRAGPSVRG
ncbi:unnamed protein product [Victoria cruziana]